MKKDFAYYLMPKKTHRGVLVQDGSVDVAGNILADKSLEPYENSKVDILVYDTEVAIYTGNGTLISLLTADIGNS